MPDVVRQLLIIALVLVICFYLLYQSRKPSRGVGRIFLKLMNRHHSAMTDWGLQNVRVEPRFHILDVGCGGGLTLEKLVALAPEGQIHGVDYAKGSLAESRSRNAQAIAAGRVQLTHASVEQMPYPDGHFDLVTAVETHYYWHLGRGLGEIRRVLRPGGMLLLIAETYRGARANWLHRLVMAPLRAIHLSPPEFAEALTQAGFAHVEVRTHPKEAWICAWGTAPTAATIV
jgi:ubiquinone/menaquinone biosynthesis C-methylase UbiE